MSEDKAKLLNELLIRYLNHKSVLLVDDEKKISSLMVNYLIQSHIEENKIVFSSNEKDALLKIQNIEFGLIIVDLLMHNNIGLNLLREIKLRAKYKNIPVLLITDNPEDENVKTAIDLGLNNLIVTPFGHDLFLEKISKALKKED